MKNVPALQLVKQIGEESFFKSQLELFWLDYQKSDDDRSIKKWDGRDSFKVYYSHTDILDPSKMGYFEISLMRNIQKKIAQRFDALNSEIINLKVEDRKSLKDIFYNVLTDLEEVEIEIRELKLPGVYKNTISTAFNHHVKLLRKKSPKEAKKKKTWNIQYLRKFSEDDGRFEDFFNRLIYEGLVETKLTYFKQFFDDKEPKTKIKWIGIKAQLVTFILELKQIDCIKSYRAYSAFTKCFETEFPMRKLSSDSRLTDKKEIEKIKDIFKELNI